MIDLNKDEIRVQKLSCPLAGALILLLLTVSSFTHLQAWQGVMRKKSGLIVPPIDPQVDPIDRDQVAQFYADFYNTPGSNKPWFPGVISIKMKL